MFEMLQKDKNNLHRGNNFVNRQCCEIFTGVSFPSQFSAELERTVAVGSGHFHQQ